MIVGKVDGVLLAAVIATDVVDGRGVVLLDYNYFQKFHIAASVSLALLFQP